MKKDTDYDNSIEDLKNKIQESLKLKRKLKHELDNKIFSNFVDPKMYKKYIELKDEQDLLISNLKRMESIYERKLEKAKNDDEDYFFRF